MDQNRPKRQSHWLLLWYRVSLGYLILTAVLGLILRAIPLGWVHWEYKYLLHTHSHIAFLGWVYGALVCGMLDGWVPEDRWHRFQGLFWLGQGSFVGMLVSFPFQGYGLYSILFSTLFVGVSLVFGVRFLSEGRILGRRREDLSASFVMAALCFMAMSALAPIALGPISKISGHGSVPYFLAVYYYLHFQYNGWMWFALVGLGVRGLEQWGIDLGSKGRWFFRMNAWGCVPAYLVSALGFHPPGWVVWVAGLGAGMQLLGWLWLVRAIWPHAGRILGRLSRGQKGLAMGLVGFMVARALFQVGVTLPGIGAWVFPNRNLIIGYLHFVLIGIITVGLWMWGWRTFEVRRRLGGFSWMLLGLGFLGTEGVLLSSGMGIQWGASFGVWMFGFSGMMGLGMVGWFFALVTPKESG